MRDGGRRSDEGGGRTEVKVEDVALIAAEAGVAAEDVHAALPEDGAVLGAVREGQLGRKLRPLEGV